MVFGDSKLHAPVPRNEAGLVYGRALAHGDRTFRQKERVFASEVEKMRDRDGHHRD